jgi:serine/threonine-protein kinase RsbW
MASLPHNFASLPPEQRCLIERKPGLVIAAFESDPNHLAAVRTAIESLCAESGFAAKAAGEVGLVVNEAIANVIRHAYKSAEGQPIQVRAEMIGDGIEINIRDWGSGKSPAAPEQRKPPDPLTPGGLGLVCIHNLMDQVLFTPQPRGMLLTVRRKLNRSDGSGAANQR